MLVTPAGMLIDFSAVHPLKALSPMLDTSVGIIVFLQPESNLLVAVSIIALQPLRLS